MRSLAQLAGKWAPAILLAGFGCVSAHAQDPVVTPIVANVVAPIVVKAVTPKHTGLAKFEGFVMNSNVAQITVRAKGNDMAIRTFSLSEQASAKMQETIDRGGYQWGDRVTILYDPTSEKAIKVKGKASRPL